jgi:tRNA-dihydrouridine synthase B
MQIGPYRIEPALILAPMAGITDKPQRKLCRRFGAAYAVSEMLASDPRLAASQKSLRRRDHVGEPGPIGVQIAGSDPTLLAEAARFNVDHGADIIDINMGCPAKKVLKCWAGSALLEDEAKVARILDAVIAAVDVPVTLKIRTGPSAERRNGVGIARIAEAAGVAALSVHGRTREQKFTGSAEYATIAAIKRAVAIPVIANGDIADAPKAAAVLAETGADGLMLGRAAQGRPWVFREIAAGLAGEPIPAAPEGDVLLDIVHEHLAGLYSLYGARQGVRVARKHIGWYLEGRSGFAGFRPLINRAETPSEQQQLVADCIAGLPPAECGLRAAA